MGNFYYWIPTVVAGFIMMIVGFILIATDPKSKNGDAPSKPV